MLELNIDDLKVHEGTEVKIVAKVKLPESVAERQGIKTRTTEQVGELRKIEIHQRVVGRKTTDNVTFMLATGSTFTFPLENLKSFTVEPVVVPVDSEEA